jgi:hypothetical protein
MRMQDVLTCARKTRARKKGPVLPTAVSDDGQNVPLA